MAAVEVEHTTTFKGSKARVGPHDIKSSYVDFPVPKMVFTSMLAQWHGRQIQNFFFVGRPFFSFLLSFEFLSF